MFLELQIHEKWTKCNQHVMIWIPFEDAADILGFKKKTLQHHNFN